MLSLFILIGCANQGRSNQLFIYQEAEKFDTTVSMAYQLYPTTDQIIVIWSAGAKNHSTELLIFKEDDSTIEFSYLNETDKKITKTFEALSASMVIDETKTEYQ